MLMEVVTPISCKHLKGIYVYKLIITYFQTHAKLKINGFCTIPEVKYFNLYPFSVKKKPSGLWFMVVVCHPWAMRLIHYSLFVLALSGALKWNSFSLT